ncbi:hypothetical protein MAPG_07151 [Magnaporthiopsis poae ATCC 64411]|uniref:Uncharacterized protein n=1 Tax=Magnaporthiopsis poae (strain ATCC 64411 / 73-15) TaxID=644358 RepID=A0A0C4E3X4_MAGP6|nr:hypothetical protein MAPG_07151 [Magnaporthiopsis poae ATCC 64411]
MVMITSSQASVAISSLIVVACTTALFLSGYAIQQRTLRDLRAAIKPAPRPSPHIFIQESSDWRAALAAGDTDGKAAGAGEEPVVIEVEQTPPADGHQEDANADGVGLEVEVDGKTQKPLSRVERRRRIKEEIRKLSQGETPVYYQRRLW